MHCPKCRSTAVKERHERTAQRYRRFRCLDCTKQFNERSSGLLNRTQYPSDVIVLVVLWRLRYKLSLRDLAEMFLIRGIVFSYEAVRDWEAKLTPALAEELRRSRKGKIGRSWYIDGASRTRACKGVWNCTRDEGGPLGAGSQVQASNHCKLLSSKTMVVSVAAKGGTTSHQVWPGEASASELLMAA